ncbi:Uncharacterised protein [Mycobacteroides abscessus subsp. abscessus]|nr:Uncharacterised protein [Mycobacteroides abscessus subsp. abscessus]
MVGCVAGCVESGGRNTARVEISSLIPIPYGSSLMFGPMMCR